MSKKLSIISFIFILSLSASAQIKYYDATNFQIIGKGDWKTDSPYYRLPGCLEGKTRQAVWDLGTNSSGIAIRFRTDSKHISAKWEVLYGNHMNHMADTGIKGIDLYALNKGKWQYVVTGRPYEKTTTLTLVSSLNGDMREYMIYLPLYDGIKSLEIGIDPNSTIEKPQINSPRLNKTVVAYGTSITQGGCATRPGMSYTSILSRKLDCNFVNLGFSGNGQLDLEVAEVMATTKADCFLIDCLPNCNLEQMDTLAVPFIKILRQKHPKTPIVLVETVIFPFADFEAPTAKLLNDKNEKWSQIYKTLKKEGDKNIYYLETEGMIGYDQEGTVDGIHSTDLGFIRYAEHAYPLLKKLIK